MTSQARTGVLLINLGTPDSPNPQDVKKYLTEFLTDGRVIPLPWIKRQLLVRRIIVPRRYKQSAASYATIWTEEGSPLMVYGQRVKKALQVTLGDDYCVELAMRYQNPSIEVALERLAAADISNLIVVPLFPQYASATTGSAHQKVMELIKEWLVIPDVSFINSYPTYGPMIDAFCKRGRQYDVDRYDHILFSFHGLPESQLRKANKHEYCLTKAGCCKTLCRKNASCYSAQCYATAQAIAEGLNLSSESYSISFQSRLGKEPWIRPYTLDTIQKRQKAGDKKLLVFCPAFVCDCLETIEEIAEQYAEEFMKDGGECFDLVEGLNDDPSWISALAQLVRERETAVATTQPAISLTP
ncbi:Ferrochelatase [Chlamydiales bacterium SCGC AG-110-P3]|nr:Ferrochelatase [Chlamydiales bacterium SCGC AG-110-P3]